MGGSSGSLRSLAIYVILKLRWWLQFAVSSVLYLMKTYRNTKHLLSDTVSREKLTGNNIRLLISVGELQYLTDQDLTPFIHIL